MKKFTSRKFALTVLAVVVAVGTGLIGLGGKVGVVAGIIVTGASTITYVITEGHIDAKAVNMAKDTISQIETITDNQIPKAVTDTINNVAAAITEADESEEK